MAAVVLVWFVDAWQQRREQCFAMIDEVHTRTVQVPPEVIEREVAEAAQHVRRDMAQRRL